MTNDQPVLDWRPNPQHWRKSEAFRFAYTPMCASLKERKGIMRTKSIFLDQGQEGACTGFGEEHVQALTPYSMGTSDAVAQQVYSLAKTMDEWPGEDYDGSSVNGAMLAARSLGRVKEWRWARTMAEVRHGLSYHGAGEAGTWWWSGMWDADDNGYIHVTGEKVGGHAYAIAGFETLPDGTRRYRIENSWGPGWGDNGGAWITEDDMARLLSDDGEMAFMTKERKNR